MRARGGALQAKLANMNTYMARLLELLGEQDPIEVLTQTPSTLEALFERFSDTDWSRTYGAGTWDARHIVAHLADVELGMGFRVRQMVAGVSELQPFDETLWAKPYGYLDPALSLETFRALRAWNLARFARFDLDDWLREAYHPERGMMSVDLSVRVSAGHDLNHLAQLASLV